ncbi:hypothetical protein AW736_14035 [Termitidicoccus mucosus]|uniref:Uncharacterized protein n=2 Tax=Termitidicoccus mucosus TaxID=1184151 RepID=A0A178IJS4_9BACT|nr:hypothetical protein AW736_14035 [Opitutaceae bacterium TSB47]
MGREGVPAAASSKSTRQTPPHGPHTSTRDLRHSARAAAVKTSKTGLAKQDGFPHYPIWI